MTKLSVLLHTDNIVLLQNGLDRLFNDCHRWKHISNVQKTKIIVLRKYSILSRYFQFTFNGERMEIPFLFRSCLFLWWLFSFNITEITLADKALIAMF